MFRDMASSFIPSRQYLATEPAPPLLVLDLLFPAVENIVTGHFHAVESLDVLGEFVFALECAMLTRSGEAV